MKWKSGVVIERDQETWLRWGEKKKKMEQEDQEILELMEAGIEDDDELLRKVSERSEDDDIGSGLRLAQFVEDYGEFIAEGIKTKVFGV